MQAAELARRIKADQAPVVLDVRSSFEFKSGHIPGAVHASLLKLLFRRNALPLEKKTPVVLTCEHGPRAQLARTILSRIGYEHIQLLDGHMAGWRRSKLPLERE